MEGEQVIPKPPADPNRSVKRPASRWRHTPVRTSSNEQPGMQTESLSDGKLWYSSPTVFRSFDYIIIIKKLLCQPNWLVVMFFDILMCGGHNYSGMANNALTFVSKIL